MGPYPACPADGAQELLFRSVCTAGGGPGIDRARPEEESMIVSSNLPGSQAVPRCPAGALLVAGVDVEWSRNRVRRRRWPVRGADQ